MTSPKQISLFTEEALTSSQEDSLVNHTQWQENERAKRMRDISGRKCLEQLERLPQLGSWAKTFTALLIGQEGWYSTKCSLTWKLKGTRYSRFYCQLFPSMHHTAEIEFGLLPTITASFGERGGNLNPQSNHDTEKAMRDAIPKMMGLLPTITASMGEPKNGNWLHNRNTDDSCQKYRELYQKGMLPTPTAMDSTNATANMKSTQVKEGSMHSMTLSRLLCTPTAQASRGNTSDKRGKGNLTDQIAEMELTTSKTSHLSPQFVMEMMGFPTDWTLLPFLNGEMNQSKQEETQ